ncbi:glycoside hydrolase family 76 protein [uncultured Bacteroides sp.]|uniref:glycoside hydrolase family 76 protein n=1 Tax=uncultured Bacteroides sp. TaxID=162156 RepID=UPI0025EB85CF|nr:glycoside hydrolase family 76 protein [uncultured Bacteroides sp.]
MSSRQVLFSLLICVLVIISCRTEQQSLVYNNQSVMRAKQTLDSLYSNYSVPGTCLLRENYPSNIADYTATYLASEEQKNTPNQYSYLWPYSGTFSAVNALFAITQDTLYQSLLDNRVLIGLEKYFDNRRSPEGYASYINTAPPSDRFYDDNIWLGIDFTDTYLITQKDKYLQKAQFIWNFIESGIDDKLGGGIYWCEQRKRSKNTCSNAPGSVFALKLFQATKDSIYLSKGEQLYNWTKEQLQDSTDYLYFDHITLDGKVGKAKFAYNSGQMMQSASMLYQFTGEKEYLADAQNIAKGCHNYFFMNYTPENTPSFKIIKKGDVWFSAVMLRGFIELYLIDNNKTYLDSFNQSLDYAWENARDNKGLFETDFTGDSQDSKKWLLTQAAMVEMYARMAAIKL